MNRNELFAMVPALQTVAVSANKNKRAKAALSQKLEAFLQTTERTLPLVLLINPDADAAKREQNALRSYARVLVAHTSQEAVEIIAAEKCLPRLVVTRNQGIGAVAVLKERGFVGPVLFIAEAAVNTQGWQHINLPGEVLEAPVALSELAVCSRRLLKKDA